jgi:hypothetical protein
MVWRILLLLLLLLALASAATSLLLSHSFHLLVCIKMRRNAGDI